MLEPWIAKVAVVAATVATIAIRAPHGQRSRSVPVRTSRKGALEIALLTLAWLAFVLPLVWVATPVLAVADYPLRLAPFLCGVAGLLAGLFIFHRSHVDLGTNWSITLELREQHGLVTTGAYRRVRHPMYLGLLIYSVGLALVLPNLVAGPASLVVMALLVAFRLGPEERMMEEAFGESYREYAARTRRLVPFVW